MGTGCLGRLKSGVDAATASAQSAEADYVFARQSLSANIAKSYLKVIETKQQTDIARKNKSILTKTMRITQAKYDNGESSAQDVALNRAQLASIEQQLISLKGSQRNALRVLEVFLGRYPNATIEIKDILLQLPPPPAGLPSELLERRPDIVSVERKIAAAYNITYQAKTARLASFSLTSEVRNSSSSLSDILNPSNLLWQLAANIVTPLMDGGKRKIDVEIATVEQKQAVSNYVQTALTAFSDVENSLDQGNTLAQEETALLEVLTESNKAYNIAELFFWSIYLVAPLLACLGFFDHYPREIVCSIEKWEKFDGLYWSFITATTVGYGDIRLITKTSKALSILIALIGMIVAVTLNTASVSLEKHTDKNVIEKIKKAVE